MIEVPAEHLRELIDSVKHARAPGEARPILTAIRFYADGQHLIAAAADNYRVAEAKVRNAGELEPTLLGIDQVALLRSLVAQQSAGIQYLKLERAGDRLRVTSPYSILELATMDGRYPDYGTVFGLAQDEPRTIAVNPRFLHDVGKIAAVYAQRHIPTMTLTLGGSLQPFLITGTNGDLTLRELIMPVRTVEVVKP